MNQLAPGEHVRFFFGSFIENKILQSFNVRITFFDLESEEKYINEQIIDPSTFIGTSSQENESKIVKELTAIAANIKKLANYVEEVPKAIKSGVNIRNIDLEKLSESELLNLLKNISLYGNDEDFLLNPYVNDTRQIIKCLRNKFMLRKNLNDADKLFLENLNGIHNYQEYIGSGDNFKEIVQKLFMESNNSQTLNK